MHSQHDHIIRQASVMYCLTDGRCTMTAAFFKGKTTRRTKAFPDWTSSPRIDALSGREEDGHLTTWVRWPTTSTSVRHDVHQKLFHQFVVTLGGRGCCSTKYMFLCQKQLKSWTIARKSTALQVFRVALVAPITDYARIFRHLMSERHRMPQ